MMKLMIVILAVLAVASAQFLYAAGPAGRIHNPYAISSDSGIRRYGSTGGIAYAPALAGGYII